ncbi:PEP-CTERM sorting domain-containing protein [Caulifigura coniformis]|nr:PEP-CTERM sorting domain-containing protein [Caulifigura coniformis]
MRRVLVLAWLSAASLVLPAQATADLVVTIGSTSIGEGGTGFVDVFLRSTTGTDLLNGFSFEFTASPVVGTNVLAFSDPQSDSQLNDPSYIFFGVSAAAGPPQTPVGDVGPENTYIGVDATDGGFSLFVPTTDVLLARLDLTTLSSAPAVAGDVFSIDLEDTSLTAFFNNGPDQVPYTSFSGTVTVSAVPEPSSLLLCAAGLGIAGMGRRRRFQKAATRKNEFCASEPVETAGLVDH